MDLSIIIPCYQAEKQIPVLAKMLSPIAEDCELIFINDGSTDRTTEKLTYFCPHAHILEQPNQGVASARNAGVATASKTYIQFLDCDDFLNIETLSQRLSIAESSDCDVLTSSWRMEIIKNANHTLEKIQPMPSQEDVITSLLYGNWWGPPHAYLLKRSAYLDLQGSDASLVNAQDFDLWLRLAIAGRTFASCDLLSGHYIRHLHKKSLARGNRSQYWSDTESVLKKGIHLLTQQAEFNEARKKATAHRLHQVARNVYPIDSVWFEKIIDDIFRIQPDFKPEGSFLYKACVAFFGFKFSEKIANLKR